MILDQLANLSRYDLPFKQDILEFLKTKDCLNLADGEYEIKGRDLFVRVMSYLPKQSQENRFETHRYYADVQVVLSGVELMQVVGADQISALTDYDQKGDYRFFTAKEYITDLIVRSNEFTVFYPGEAHRPSCQYATHTKSVKKLVFKIKIS